MSVISGSEALNLLAAYLKPLPWKRWLFSLQNTSSSRNHGLQNRTCQNTVLAAKHQQPASFCTDINISRKGWENSINRYIAYFSVLTLREEHSTHWTKSYCYFCSIHGPLLWKFPEELHEMTCHSMILCNWFQNLTFNNIWRMSHGLYPQTGTRHLVVHWAALDRSFRNIPWHCFSLFCSSKPFTFFISSTLVFSRSFLSILTRCSCLFNSLPGEKKAHL